MKWLRWLPAAAIPTAIAVSVLAVGVAAVPNTADPPKRTPEQVVAMIGQSSVRALSGTVRQSSQLGLPQLPTTPGPGAPQDAAHPDTAALLELLTGSHTARVYLDGPDKARVQVQDTLAERDLVRNGSDVWAYDSKTNTATRLSVPAGAAKDAAHDNVTHTPAEAAHRVLAAIGQSTKVSLGANTTVAGRSAYDLVLEPRSATTLVDTVSIAVDAKTGLPLRVQVQARGQHDPAFQVAFTALNLQKPPAGRFVFTPPPGATLKKLSLPTLPSQDPAGTSGLRQQVVSGSGWDTVIGLPAGTIPAKLAGSPLLSQMATPVAGGRLVSTSLMNILVTDDGAVFAGAVPSDQLLAAAHRP